jgi:hypothetical protein
MTLRDDEQRSLAAIERSLTRSDPRLAWRLAEVRTFTPGSVRALISGCAAMHAGGVVIAVASAEVDSLVSVVIGAGLAIGFPGLALWHLWWRWR